MATIVPLIKKGGSVTYTAQIRLRIDGRQVGDKMTSADRGFLELWVQSVRLNCAVLMGLVFGLGCHA